jgi:hypothetical protein
MVRYQTCQPELLTWPQLPFPIMSGWLGTQTYPKDTLLANQFDLRVANASLAIPLRVGLEVAQVSNMTDLIVWGTVCLAMWVDFLRRSKSVSSNTK